MMEYLGVCINKVGAIVLSVVAITPSSQEASEIFRSLKRGFLRSKFATRDVENDMMRVHSRTWHIQVVF